MAVELDQELIKSVKNDIEKAYEAIKDYHDTQKRLNDLYRNEYVPNDGQYTPKVEANLYLANIETQMPVVDDHLGWVIISGQSENDAEYANIMQLRMDDMMLFGGFREAVLQASKDSKIMRNGLIQAQMIIENVEPSALYPDGRKFVGLRYIPVDPCTFIPAPGWTGTDIREQCDFLAFKTPMNIKKIKRLWGIDVDPEGSLDKHGLFIEADKADKYADHAIVWEYYAMDDDIRKYPEGRALMWVQEQGLIDSPLDCHVPYFNISNYTTAHTGKGISDVELAKPFVEVINEVLSNNSNTAINEGKPIYRGKQAFIDKLKSKIQNMIKAGVVIPDEGGELHVDRPAELSQSAYNVPVQLKDFLNDVSGIFDTFAGKQKGDLSGKAHAILETAAMRRVRLHLSKDVKPCMQAIGEYSLNMLQKYDKEVINLRKQIDPLNHEWVKYDPNSMRDTKFNVVVKIGAADRAEKVAEVLEEIDRGLSGPEEYFEAKPGRDNKAKLERYYQRQGIAAEMERLKNLDKARKELTGLAESILGMLDKPEKTSNDIDRLKLKEDQVMYLIKEHRELTEEKAWAFLPPDMQGRIVQAAFVKQPPQEVAA